MKSVKVVFGLAFVLAVAAAIVTGVLFNRYANEAERQIAAQKASCARLQHELSVMTKRYNDESSENAAVMKYLSNIPRKMDFAAPFGFKLRQVVDKSRILPSGIYIRDGQYDDFEAGDLVIDRDTMAFAKICASRLDETPEDEIKAYMAMIEKRIDADLAAAKYPFKVTRRVWNDNGIVNFEIVDVETEAKMSARKTGTCAESCEKMRKFAADK